MQLIKENFNCVCPEYPHTDNLFPVDRTTHKYDTTVFKNPVFDLIKEWVVTEKIDGTNTRVFFPWEGKDKIKFYGHYINSQLPHNLSMFLKAHFTEERIELVQDLLIKHKVEGITLYGEGYGKGIQKAGNRYRKNGVSFRLFDVLIGNRWLQRDEVLIITSMLSLETPPVYSIASSLEEIINTTQKGRSSIITLEEYSDEISAPAEGVVCIPPLLLFDNYGNRIKFKLKTALF